LLFLWQARHAQVLKDQQEEQMRREQEALFGVHNIQNGMLQDWSVFQNHKHAQASLMCVSSKNGKRGKRNVDRNTHNFIALASESPKSLPLILSSKLPGNGTIGGGPSETATWMPLTSGRKSVV